MTEEDILVNVLNNIKSINIESVRNNFHFSVKEHFIAYEKDINNLYSLIDKILENKERINEFIKDQVTEETRKLLIIINEIKGLSENRTDNNEQIITKIQNIFNNLNHDKPYLGNIPFYFHYRKLALLATSIGVFSGTDEFKKKYQEANKAYSEIKEILASAKSASADLGVSIHSEIFKKIADEYKSSSEKWLCRTIILSATLVLSLIAIFIYYFCSKESGLNYNLISIKLLFFTFLFTATIWSGNKFKILCHLHTINLHKATSLQTFKTFVDATNREDTKDAVLLECVKAIFVPPETGYIKSEEKNSGTNIIEVMKNFKSG